MDTTDKPAKRKFTKTLKREDIEIDGVDYYLQEMTGIIKDRWQDGQRRRVTVAKDGSVKVNTFENAEAELIQQCLYDQHDGRVPIATIENFPSSLQKQLFEACQEMNALTDKAADEEKKD